MNAEDLEWETWLLDVGDPIITKVATFGRDSLTLIEWMILCWWELDYGMRDAGDLATVVEDMHPNVLAEALACAEQLKLPAATRVFRLSQSEIEAHYFEFFIEVCKELKAALRSG
jgi:hypothetical protein